MCSPLHPLACQFFGRISYGLVLAHIEPTAWLVLNAHFGEFGNVLDEAVSCSMLQNLARETHVSTQRADTELG